MNSPKRKYIAQTIKLALLICTLSLQSAVAQAADIEKIKKFNLVFSNSFFEHVNEMDARASLKLFAKKYESEWEKITGQKLLVNVLFTNDFKSISEILELKIPSLITLTAIEYFNNNIDRIQKPLFVRSGESMFLNLLLIVRKDSHIKTLVDLQKKIINFTGGVNGEISTIWFSKVLLENQFNVPAKFCLKYESVLKPSQALLNVYFKKKDACIINRTDYELVCELNPQVYNETIILFQSKPLLPAAPIIINDSNKIFEHFITNFVKNLGKEGYGNQLLTLFKMESVTVFKDEYIFDVKNLIQEYNALIKGKK